MPDAPFHWWTHSQENSRLEQVSFNEFRAIVFGAPAHRFMDKLILHHTWSPTVADYHGASTWKGIDRYHEHTRGWSDIGYHLGVDPAGLPWLLRPLRRSGGHTLGQNARSIGVTMIGNFDKGEDDPERTLPRVCALLALLALRYDLTADDVHFHRDFASKTCPGTAIRHTRVRELVALAMDQNQPIPRPVPFVPDLAQEINEGVDADEPDTDGRFFVSSPPGSNNWREVVVANSYDMPPKGKVFLV